MWMNITMDFVHVGILSTFTHNLIKKNVGLEIK